MLKPPSGLSPIAVSRYWIHDQILVDRKNYRSNESDVAKFRVYDKGEQEQKMTEEMKKILFGILEEQTGNKYCDNVCHQIIFETANRVIFKGWQCKDKKVNDWLSQLFLTAKVQDRQGAIHYDTFRDGNHAVILSWDNDGQRVRFSREPWWDGSTGIFVMYDTTDEPSYAVNEFIEMEDDKKIIRRVIYFPDEFQRWVSRDDGATWLPSPKMEKGQDDEGNEIEQEESWPMPWTRLDGEGTPLNIPVVHFANAGSSTQNHGSSELDGGILGGQDQLNDLQWQMCAGGRQTAFQVTWATGVDTANEDGTQKSFRIGPGSMLTDSNENAAFGVLPAGDMSKLIGIYDKKLARISQQAAVPLHIITGGDWPSGEALLRAEQPAIGKANRQINRLDNAWILLAHRATEIHNRFTKSGDLLNEDVETAPISASFEDTERRDPLSQSQIVQALGDRISDEEALRRMGYSDADAQKIIKEKQAAADKAAQQFATQFNRGTAPGSGLPGKGPVEDNAQATDNNKTVPQSDTQP